MLGTIGVQERRRKNPTIPSQLNLCYAVDGSGNPGFTHQLRLVVELPLFKTTGFFIHHPNGGFSRQIFWTTNERSTFESKDSRISPVKPMVEKLVGFLVSSFFWGFNPKEMLGTGRLVDWPPKSIQTPFFWQVFEFPGCRFLGLPNTFSPGIWMKFGWIWMPRVMFSSKTGACESQQNTKVPPG